MPFFSKKPADAVAVLQRDADELRANVAALEQELLNNEANVAEMEQAHLDQLIARKPEDATKSAAKIADTKRDNRLTQKAIEKAKQLLSDKEQEIAALLDKQRRENEAAECKKLVAEFTAASQNLVSAARVFAGASEALVLIAPEALGGRNLAQSVAHELPAHSAFVEGQVKNYIEQLLGGMIRPRAVEPVADEAIKKAETPVKSREIMKPRRAELHPAIEVIDRGPAYTAQIAVAAA
jgi:hypothetical protein